MSARAAVVSRQLAKIGRAVASNADTGTNNQYQVQSRVHLGFTFF